MFPLLRYHLTESVVNDALRCVIGASDIQRKDKEYMLVRGVVMLYIEDRSRLLGSQEIIDAISFILPISDNQLLTSSNYDDDAKVELLKSRQILNMYLGILRENA